MISPLVLAQRDHASRRHFHIALFCFILLLIAYCDRVNLATAVPAIMSQYGWSSVRMGWVLSAFFLGYTCCLIPAGILVQCFGPWRVLTVCIVGWSVATACTPLSHSLGEIYCMRFLVGVCESAVFPSINSLLAESFLPDEYARAAGFCWSGGYAGPILAFPLAGVVMGMQGWKTIFYVFALLGVLLLLLLILVAGSPLNCLHFRPRSAPRAPRSITPRKKLLMWPALWALLILHFSSNWFAYVLLSWLPAYFQQARHFSVGVTALASSMPFATALAGTSIFAWITDRASANRPRTLVRKRLLAIYVLCAPRTAAVAFDSFRCADCSGTFPEFVSDDRGDAGLRQRIAGPGSATGSGACGDSGIIREPCRSAGPCCERLPDEDVLLERRLRGHSGCMRDWRRRVSGFWPG